MTPEPSDQPAMLQSVGVLNDDSRRRMFSFIRRARRAVTRDEAAESIGISRKLAAFHLDKMVTAGLLHARYEATGDTPKVGRRPKVYEATDLDLAVSIPGRQFRLLADLLLDSIITGSDNESGAQAATRTAHERGVALGEAEGGDMTPPHLHGIEALPRCAAMLEDHGYEPIRGGAGELRLHNCPFHPLAAKAPELVCGINHAFLTGYLEGLGANAVTAHLVPTPGECCVRLTASDCPGPAIS
ncbi:MAG: helix-turn-helix transcriptional regulator [Marmoricola sp.]